MMEWTLSIFYVLVRCRSSTVNTLYLSYAGFSVLPSDDPGESNLQCLAEISSQLPYRESSSQTDVSVVEPCFPAGGLPCSMSDVDVCSDVQAVTSRHCSSCTFKQKQINLLTNRLKKIGI